MATVFRAERQSDRLIVALKQLHPQIAFDSRMIERFARGAEIMMELHHPGIAEVYEYFEEGGNYFQAEEYLPGGSLVDYLDAHNGTVEEKQALIWCRQALLAVDHAHQNGVLHRDLKPGNLMLDAAGRIKVTDFGIAKVLGSSRVTVAGDQLGTAAYMSPEQIQSPMHVSHLTDVYSMGVVLFELLTGRVPFAAGDENSESDFETRRAVVQDAPRKLRPLNPRISRRLERLVLRALEKTPSHRFGGAAEFAATIDRYLATRQLPDIIWAPHLHPAVMASGGAALIFLLGLWIGAAAFRKPPPPLQRTLATERGTSVQVDPTGEGDRVWVARNADNVIKVDLASSRITILGFPNIAVDDLRPHDPQVDRACQELQEAKVALERSTENRTDPSSAVNPSPANPSAAKRKTVDEAFQTQQERVKEAFIDAAKRWLNFNSRQPCQAGPQ